MSIVGYLKDVNDAENLYEIMAGTLTIGRGEGNDVKLASRSVSTRHAELEMDLGRRPPRILLRDLGSRNATFVNEVRVMGTTKPIQWGDVLRFGYDQAAYRLIKFEDYQKELQPKEAPEPPIPPHQRPAAGITSGMSHVQDREFFDGVMDRSFNSPPKERPDRQRRSGDGNELMVSHFDGIGYQRVPAEVKDNNNQQAEVASLVGGQGGHHREESQRPQSARPVTRGGEWGGGAENGGSGGRDGDHQGYDRMRTDDYDGHGHGPGGGRHGRHSSIPAYQPGLPPPDALGGNKRDLDELMEEEDRRLADELAKKRRDLEGDQPKEPSDEDKILAENMAELQRQVQALVTELAIKEKALAELQGDDLARCLLDAQEGTKHLREMMTTKDAEIQRLRNQLKALGTHGADQWERIDTSADYIRLKRENEEWKARDEQTARRWTEMQEQAAAFATRVAELETLLARQRDSAEEDAMARDTEIRAMNKRMAEIASANDPSKLEAARFLVDQVSEQEKAMRLQKDHSLQLEARMLELKRENEYLRGTLNGLGADQGGNWQEEALRRMRDQVDELRAQGGVQSVIALQDEIARKEKDLQAKEKELLVYKEKVLKFEAVQMHDRDTDALQEQLRQKDQRLTELEEAKYSMELEQARMTKLLDDLQRKDAINRAAASARGGSATASVGTEPVKPAPAMGFVARATPSSGVD